MAESKTLKNRHLTKSLYKLAIECPTKLYFMGKPEYANEMNDDPFMMALAEGGFQVGALAKLYYPAGKGIFSKDNEGAVKETADLLKQENITIFEAAITTANFYIRTDILVKRGNRIDLIEVKAKSIDMGESEDPFAKKKGGITSEWKPYMEDVAFQKYVLSKAFPQYDISAFLMLADKASLCPTDGLNQKFKIIKDKNGRKSIKVSNAISTEDLSREILIKIRVDEYCNMIYVGDKAEEVSIPGYTERLQYYADKYEKDEKIETAPSTTCAKCEFRASAEEKAKGLKSGFEECWMKIQGCKEKDLEGPTVLNIWNCRKKTEFINNGKFRMIDIEESDIAPKRDDKKQGLSQSQRQWLQIEKVKNNDSEVWIDRDGLRQAMDKFVFPLHFIDFETTMVAIPFNKGRHPYEGIAFQFSHHMVHEDGRVEHRGEYLNVEAGVFPNYDFVRALKKELEKDEGSIFRYSHHENTFLNHIKAQLKADAVAIPDKELLIDFIKSITNFKDEKWEGARSMIDLCELEKRFYYNPHTKGSNSIKKVLPAILNSSKYLQNKYSKPIYGAKGGIPSINYKDWTWLKMEDGEVINPYRQLPKMFQELKEDVELLSDSDELGDGGAALTAYAKLQFEEMSEYEREELKAALLKYCELDTLAMVMIYECWRELLKG
jgi:hypothetical protein